jgi:uncharacterized membrane protein YcaP (DUF421 family)
MAWFAVAFLVAVAVAMVMGRRPLAQMQAAVMGGRMVPGCVIAEAAALLVLAVLIFVFRQDF